MDAHTHAAIGRALDRDCDACGICGVAYSRLEHTYVGRVTANSKIVVCCDLCFPRLHVVLACGVGCIPPNTTDEEKRAAFLSHPMAGIMTTRF